ncbi:SDR family oxidoreductase [Jatrophihabitans sp. YIM 134969]
MSTGNSTDSTPRRVAVVTGGSRGIGAAAATALGAAGYAVVVGYAGNAGAAARTVDAITGAGGEAVAVAADVADEHAVAALFDAAERQFGGVDVTVNAAGIMKLAPIADFDLDAFDQVQRTNVRGTFLVLQQAARRTRPGGTVITFSTSVVGTNTPTYGPYVASKAATEGFTLILARELRGRDVTVNTVAPGPTATDLFLDGKTEEEVSRLAHAVPLDRLGQPADIAGAVVFLASPAGHWVNGQTLRVNGGLV